MCCYWNHLNCTTLSETLLSCQKNWTLSAADDVVWTMCCYWNNNLLHITSTNPWVSQRLGHFLQQMMLCELYVPAAATGTIINCTTLPQLFEVLKLDTSAAKVCVWLSLKLFFLSFLKILDKVFIYFSNNPKYQEYIYT